MSIKETQPRGWGQARLGWVTCTLLTLRSAVAKCDFAYFSAAVIGTWLGELSPCECSTNMLSYQPLSFVEPHDRLFNSSESEISFLFNINHRFGIKANPNFYQTTKNTKRQKAKRTFNPMVSSIRIKRGITLEIQPYFLSSKMRPWSRARSALYASRRGTNEDPPREGIGGGARLTELQWSRSDGYRVSYRRTN